MPATRRASRRRRQRAVRVVSLRSAASPLPEDALNGWHTGIGGLQLLGRHFPDFFREHAAARAVEPAQLLGCCAAFFQLVKQAGLPLRDIGDSYAYDELEFADTPAETLRMYNAVSMEYLSNLGYYLWVPRPSYFGLGVESMLDEGGQSPGALTATLWHLFQHTPLGMGVDLHAFAEHLDTETRYEIERIKPLSKDAPIHLLAAHLAIPEAQGIAESKDDVLRATGQLIEYAFGKTGNELANHSDYDVEAIHMGDTDEQWAWRELPELARLSAEAQALEHAYGVWAARVGQNPAAVRQLGIAVHKAARAARVELLEAPKTLLTLLDRRLVYEEQPA